MKGEHSAFLKQPQAVEEHVLGGARELPGDRSLYKNRGHSIILTEEIPTSVHLCKPCSCA